MLKKKVKKYKYDLEKVGKENQCLNIEKDQTILQMKTSFVGKMEGLQREVEQMKVNQCQKSAYYKKMKHEFSKLKSKSKHHETLISKFINKFENDIAFARNWVLSFERDLSNMTNLDHHSPSQQLDEYLNNCISYAENMKQFIAQVESSMTSIRKNNM